MLATQTEPNVMKIFIINLERSTDRRTKIDADLQPLALDYSFFNAVDGSVENFHFSERYNAKKRLFMRGRELQRGQIANFASHISLWEKCVELDTPVVVLEDDAVINDNFAEAIPLAAKEIEEFGCIRFFGNNLNKHEVVRALDDNYRIALSVFGTTCSNSYALHPWAAKQLLAHCNEIQHSIDVYMNHSHTHGVSCFVMLPMPVGHDTTQPTTISNRIKNKKTLLQKCVRELDIAYIRTATYITAQKAIRKHKKK